MQGERKVAGGVDQRYVREGLRKVAKRLAGLGVQHLRIQPKVIAAAEHALEQDTRLVQFADGREVADEPKRAHGEDAFVAVKAVIGLLGRVASQEPIHLQLGPDTVHRRAHPGVFGRQEANHRHHEQRGVSVLRAVVLHERLQLFVPASLKHIRVDFLSERAPAVQVNFLAKGLGQEYGPVEGEPTHHFGMDEMTHLATDLPHAPIWAVPVVDDGLDETLDRLPEAVMDLAARTMEGRACDHHLSEDVELEMTRCRIPDANWFGTPVAFQVIECKLC